MVSNKHFPGVINLYAKVTLEIGVAAWIQSWPGEGVRAGAATEARSH
jgi:hypothetical protein